MRLTVRYGQRKRLKCRVPTAHGHGKCKKKKKKKVPHREFGYFAKTQGKHSHSLVLVETLLFAQVVNSLILK